MSSPQKNTSLRSRSVWANASELPRTMTGREVAAPLHRERGRDLGANRLGDRAARAKTTAGRWVNRAGRLAGERQALALPFSVGIGDRHRRDEVAWVGVG